MSLSVMQCASSLNVTTAEVLAAAKRCGISVSDIYAPLSFQQLAQIEGALQQKDDFADQKAAAARNMLEHFVSSYKIFVDTSSLLSPYAELFFANLIPLLQKYGASIIIPKRVIDELYKHQANQNDEALAKKATKALRNLQTMLAGNQIEVRGEEGDNFADNVFQVVFTKFRIRNNLLLITEDNDLARDILSLNQNQSVRGKAVCAKRLSKYGYLAAYGWENAQPRTVRPVIKSGVPQEQTQHGFRPSTGMKPEQDAPVTVSSVPGANEQVLVYANGWKTMRLGEKIAAGGEGVIYAADAGLVAKIYKKENITRLKQEKIKRMVAAGLQYPGICFPVGAVYNLQREFVGYLMPRAEGRELQRSVFIKPVFQKTFPDWKRRDTVELCVTILEKIKYLHDHNILMGDINPGNILVASPKNVWFVDADSYQIEDLPCPVGTVNFTAPEIQGKRYADFLRTPGNEFFAVATLLFMIMLPGKAPYAQQGGGDQIENIRGMNFSYPFGDQGNRQTPDGPWRFIWSHLTYDVKKAFYNTFRSGGEHCTEETRLNADEWLNLFRYYLRLLDDGKLRAQDPMSEELFPTRHKLNPNVTYVTCKLCGQPVNEKSAREGICRTCLDEGEVVKCEDCGEEFIFTNYQKYVKKHTKPRHCKTCGEKVAHRISCVDCGRSFTVTKGEEDFYLGSGKIIPKRCKHCRQQNREGQLTYRPAPVTQPRAERTQPASAYRSQPATVNRTQPASTYRSQPASAYRGQPAPAPAAKPAAQSDKGSKCFITTAVCSYMGKADDCAELRALRDFRDEWLAFQPGGRELIERYYEIAPGIVARIESSPFYEYYCREIWSKYLEPCLEMMEAGNYEACKNHYMDMVNRFSALL